MEGKLMFTGRWLAAIEFSVKTLFWGIGYFFGFTLVTMLSVGTVFAEEYSCVVRGRNTKHRYWLFAREGRFYLVAEVVSAIGWFFLATVVWTIALLTGIA